MYKDGKRCITIFCFHKIFQYFEDYIHGLHDVFYVEIVLFYEGFSFKYILSDSNPIYLFFQYIPVEIQDNIKDYKDNNIKLCVFNTEQLSRLFYCNFLNNMSEYIHRVDYSKGNISYISSNLSSIHIPYQYHMREIIYDKIPKTRMICMMDPGKSLHRKYILDELEKEGIKVDLIKGFGETRDMELFQYKILLNIHFSDEYKVFEELRCNRAIFNRMIVVSELSINDNDFMFRNHLIVSPYNQLVEVVKETICNYEKYYHFLFDSFECPKSKLEEMAKISISQIDNR